MHQWPTAQSSVPASARSPVRLSGASQPASHSASGQTRNQESTLNSSGWSRRWASLSFAKQRTVLSGAGRRASGADTCAPPLVARRPARLLSVRKWWSTPSVTLAPPTHAAWKAWEVGMAACAAACCASRAPMRQISSWCLVYTATLLLVSAARFPNNRIHNPETSLKGGLGLKAPVKLSSTSMSQMSQQLQLTRSSALQLQQERAALRLGLIRGGGERFDSSGGAVPPAGGAVSEECPPTL